MIRGTLGSREETDTENHDPPVAMLLLGGWVSMCTPRYQQSLFFQDSSPPAPNNCSNAEGWRAGSMLANCMGIAFCIISSPYSPRVNKTLGRGGKLFCVLPQETTKHIPALLPQFGLNKVSGGSKMTDSGLGNTVFPIHLKFSSSGPLWSLDHINYIELWTRRPLSAPDLLAYIGPLRDSRSQKICIYTFRSFTYLCQRVFPHESN